MKNTKRLITCFLISFLLVINICEIQPMSIPKDNYKIENPYIEVNWQKVNQIKANLHTHTNKSDGKDSIQNVINKHAELGYGVLAITDHNRLTFPWNDPIKGDKGAVIPKGLNSISGSEYSLKQHHINGFFIKNIDSFSNEEDVLNHIEKQGGIAQLNHPGRYKKSLDWYVNLYNKYNNLVGLEVINRTDRYPNDRQIWDDILTKIIDKRNVFGLANTDSHKLADIDTSYNVILIDGEYSEEKIKNALQNGEFYFSSRICKENDRSSKKDVNPPIITNINVDNESFTITINGENIKAIDWIGSNGKHISSGKSFQVVNNISTPYIRAVIKGDGGVTFTQPFKIIDKNQNRIIE